MIALLLAGPAWAQTYDFPTSLDGRSVFYPTAYVDHAGDDWGCGDLTYGGHHGSDFGVGGFEGMDAGRDVTSAAPGVVIATNDGEFDRCETADCPGGGGFGNYVQVLHDDGKTTTYGHLKQWTVSVAVGDTVACGQLLGQVGSSGYSTGPHLHFEVRNASGYAEDPFDGPCSAAPSYWTEQGSYGDVPDILCLEPQECEPVALLSCGTSIQGRTDDSVATSASWSYGCTDFVYSGPERVWSFVTNLDEDVTLTLTGLDEDLDLYVVDSVACDGSDCRSSSSEPLDSDEQITFAAEAGRAYVVVVDGWQGAAGPFELHIDCVGSVEPPDPEPVDTGEPELPTEDPPVREDLEAGCGCAVPTGAGAASPAALLLGLLLQRRR